jgi:fused signal recognition particle receptor
MGLFDKFKKGLEKTRSKLGTQLRGILSRHVRIDEELYEELEETLITSDVGIESTLEILESLREKVRRNPAHRDHPEIVWELLAESIEEMIRPAVEEKPLNLDHHPAVILIVGVNGSGKTTTIAKMAKVFQGEGKRVIFAAADTFRAAAIEQLLEWGKRLNVPVIHQQSGADPAAVAFDALQAAKARGYDLLIIDTAGRLHNKANLMQELAKIARVLKKQDPEAPHEVFLVLDATTGQNMIQQAKVFQEISGVTGLILTKLDGTAKGGAVISVCRQLNLPLRYLGLGEKMDDLQPFDAAAFARAFISTEEIEIE